MCCPHQVAALITFLALAAARCCCAAAALLVTGAFGLALASGSWGTGAATVVERGNGVFGRSGGKQ